MRDKTGGMMFFMCSDSFLRLILIVSLLYKHGRYDRTCYRQLWRVRLRMPRFMLCIISRMEQFGIMRDRKMIQSTGMTTMDEICIHFRR